jgi:hypothetical protein
MRQKMTWRRTGPGADRRPADDEPLATGQSPAQWIVANEAGWGIPHGPGGMLAALAWGYVAAGLLRVIRAVRRPRPRADDSRSRAGESRPRRPR